MELSQARAVPGTGVAANLAATGNFGPIAVKGRRLSIIASWTGTPTGTFSLETSFDNTTWVTVPGAATEFTANGNAQPAGGASSAVWNWINPPGNMVRIRFTQSGGTGMLTARYAWGD